MSTPFADLAARVRGTASHAVEGRIHNAAGLLVEATLPSAAIGEVCEIGPPGAGRLAEVVGLREATALLVPLGTNIGLRAGDPVRRLFAQTVGVGDALLGRIVDALGDPLDGKPKPRRERDVPIYEEPLPPMARGPVNQPFYVGIRAVDGFLTLARGMRIGIFAAAGVGKSTFVGTALRNTRATVNVVALIGERGREVSEFVQHILGEDGMRRSVIVVATSDRSPLERVRAAFAATAIAEHFRDRGDDVLLVLDSLTRFGMAQREIGLAVGEPTTTKGYTPSVFAMLPKLLERVCPAQKGGSITGIYTVLVEGDDINDPLADAARGLLDGHIVLSRQLAARGHYPAIDVLKSISRVMDATVSAEHSHVANDARELLANAAEAQELIDFGAYTPGKNPRFDKALERMGEMNAFLRQSPREASPPAQTVAQLTKLGVRP